MSRIGLMQRFKNVLGEQPIDDSISTVPISVWDELYLDHADTHLRQSALDTVIGKIKNTSNLIMFDTKDDNLNHLLNVRPNDNDNKSSFRNKVIDRMLYDGAALVIRHNEQLYVADSFIVDDRVFGQKTYKNIVIENLTLDYKTFKSSEVFYFAYPNKQLKKFLKDLDNSYAKLFNRLIDVHMRNNQIRIYAKFKQGAKDKETQEVYKKFLRGAEDKIRNDSVAMIPTQDDYDLNENAQSYESRSIKEVGDLENLYIRQVANILQVPPLLFSGDLADISQHKDSYIKDCIRPLLTVWVDEINAKYFSRKEYIDGKRLKLNTIFATYNNEFEMAKDIEKLVGSVAFIPDDILEMLGHQRKNTPVTTQHYITKNMTKVNSDGSIQDG